MIRKRLKIVIDTNVLVSRLLAPTSLPAQAVRYIIDNELIIVSDSTLIELREVLLRSKFDKYISTEARILFINGLDAITTKIEINRTIKYCRDHKDDKLLELAVNGKADYIITGDDDLLILKEFENIRILSPKNFLDSLT